MSENNNADLGLAILGLATRGMFTVGLDGIALSTPPAAPPPPPPSAPAPAPASWRESVDAAVAKASLAFKTPPSESEHVSDAEVLRARIAQAERLITQTVQRTNESKTEKRARKIAKLQKKGR